MGKVYVGVINNTLLDPNDGDLSPHTSQKIYDKKVAGSQNSGNTDISGH